jgi:hypothetical protein
MTAHFYVTAADTVGKTARLAGPFGDEPTARRWVRPTRKAAQRLTTRAFRYRFGVTEFPSRVVRPGMLNARLDIPTDQLVAPEPKTKVVCERCHLPKAEFEDGVEGHYDCAHPAWVTVDV